MQHVWALILGAIPASAAAAEGPDDFLWRDDFTDARGWAARPAWLADPSSTASVSSDGQVGCFRVDEARRGMKWPTTGPARIASGTAGCSRFSSCTPSAPRWAGAWGGLPHGPSGPPRDRRRLAPRPGGLPRGDADLAPAGRTAQAMVPRGLQLPPAVPALARQPLRFEDRHAPAGRRRGRGAAGVRRHRLPAPVRL